MELCSNIPCLYPFLFGLMSTSCAIETTRSPFCYCGDAFDEVPSIEVLERDGYGAVFAHEAGDADVSALAHFVEGGVVVAQGEKLFQAAGLAAYVDELILGVVAVECLDLGAVGAALHNVYLCHSVSI